jgi:hypothetical protein
MKTTYLVWKDPACGGTNPEWQEISGKEFYALVSTDKGRKRRFVRLFSTEPDSSDGDIVMEATAEEYRKWRKEKDHGDWVREGQEALGHKVVSYHAMETEDGVFGEELLRDENCNVEAEVIRSIMPALIPKALSLLNEDELYLIGAMYLSKMPMGLQEYADEIGISKQLAFYRRNAVLQKLGKFFEE